MVGSETELCSNALNLLGEQSITSLTDGTVRATLCKTHYPVVRDSVLEMHPWNFATARAELAVLSATPTYKWTRQFQLPSDCLRIIGTDPDRLDYEIDGTALLCDETQVYIRYVYRFTDTSKFPSTFVMALEFFLAHLLAPPLKVDAKIAEQMAMAYRYWLAQAKIADGQNQPTALIDADDLIDERAIP
jgi:hypothetical protein